MLACYRESKTSISLQWVIANSDSSFSQLAHGSYQQPHRMETTMAGPLSNTQYDLGYPETDQPLKLDDQS